jgi:hypothetical protein
MFSVRLSLLVQAQAQQLLVQEQRQLVQEQPQPVPQR